MSKTDKILGGIGAIIGFIVGGFWFVVMTVAPFVIVWALFFR